MRKLISLSAILVLTVVVFSCADNQKQTAPATMTTNNANTDTALNKKLLAAVMEKVFNAHNLSDKVDKYYAPSYIQHNRSAPPGREGMKQFFAQLFAAFPDWKGEITHTMAEGDQVNIYVTWTGTHTGAFMGTPATKRKVTIYTADRFRIENGVIAEHWDVVDNVDMLATIGAINFKGESNHE